MSARNFATLKEFKDWWLRTRQFRPPLHGVYIYPGTKAITLYRQGQYQVQMVCFDPYVTVKEHSHPNIESYEYVIRYEQEKPEEDTELSYDITSGAAHTKIKQTLVHLPPSTPHSGKTGANGGVFLSIQKWLNGVSPTCVGLDSSDETLATTWCIEEKIK